MQECLRATQYYSTSLREGVMPHIVSLFALAHRGHFGRVLLLRKYDEQKRLDRMCWKFLRDVSMNLPTGATVGDLALGVCVCVFQEPMSSRYAKFMVYNVAGILLFRPTTIRIGWCYRASIPRNNLDRRNLKICTPCHVRIRQFDSERHSARCECDPLRRYSQFFAKIIRCFNVPGHCYGNDDRSITKSRGPT